VQGSRKYPIYCEAHNIKAMGDTTSEKDWTTETAGHSDRTNKHVGRRKIYFGFEGKLSIVVRSIALGLNVEKCWGSDYESDFKLQCLCVYLQ
jgi:hypothetical protein